MKKVFQNLILIGSVLLVISANAKAQQVVSANGKTYVLTKAQISYLRRFKDPVINKAIDSLVSIKYNATADVIVAILSSAKAPKIKPQLLTSK